MIDAELRRTLIGLQSRHQALWIYGLMALLVGVMMALSGAPGPVEEHFGPASRLYLGAPLAVGGALVIVGSFWASERRLAHYGAIVGMILFTLWALAMTIFYAIAGAQEGFVVAGPGQEIERTAGRPYVPALYQGIMWLAALHVVTLFRLGPPRRPVH